MDQDKTWHAGRPRHWPHCVRWGPSSPSLKGAQTPIFGPCLYCGQTAMCIRIPFGMEVGLSLGDIVLDGDKAPPAKGGSAAPPPLFGPCLLWPRWPISATAELLFTYIFAVLLQDLSRLSCHSIQRMFLKINTRHQAHKPVNKCDYWARFSTDHNFAIVR